MERFLSNVKYWFLGLLITPVVLACATVGTILSIPVFVRWMPWHLLRRPVVFVGVVILQFLRMLAGWVSTCGYGRVFFADSVSSDHHPQSWQLPFGLRFRYRLLLTAQRYFGMLRFRRWEQRLRSESLEYCRRNPPAPHQVHMQIPRVRPDEITPSEFYQKYVKNPHPVILSGLNSNSHAVRNWVPEYFRKYSEDMAPMQTDDEDDLYARKTKFGEYLDYIRDNMDVPVEQRPMHYLANFANLCNAHPELIDELEVKKMATWMPDAFRTNLAGVHLFIGLQGTYTPFHCANTPNWFFQVQGQKRWTFVHPDYMLMMYPILTADAFYAGCQMAFPEPDADITNEDFPLWQYCPRHEAVLEPGDVLFNPSWWWHRIMNESSPTIGCATRWIILPNAVTNSLFDFYLNWCSYFYCNALTLIGKLAFRQPVLTDETTLTVAQRRGRVDLVMALRARRPSEQRAKMEHPPTKKEEEVPVST